MEVKHGTTQGQFDLASCLHFFVPAVSLSYTPLFKNKVEDEIKGKSGGIDWGMADG